MNVKPIHNDGSPGTDSNVSCSLLSVKEDRVSEEGTLRDSSQRLEKAVNYSKISFKERIDG